MPRARRRLLLGRLVWTTAAGIPVGQVLSGRHRRVYDTAIHAFGDAEMLDVLTLTAALDPVAREGQPAALRRLLATRPDPGTNTLMFSHNGMFMALTGATIERAEGAIIAVDGEGGFSVVTVLPWNGWGPLAGMD